MLWIIGIFTIYLVLLLFVTWFSLHPTRIPIFSSPGALGAPQEDVAFDSTDGTPLKGWWVEAPEPTGIAILFHGYFMNRSELAHLAHRLYGEGISSLLIDFRAHGRSGGKRCTLGYREKEDVKASVGFARTRHTSLPIVLIGSSMGAASAAFALGDDPSLADALVLDSAFSSLSSASVGWWRFVGGQPLAWFFSPVTLLAIPLVRYNPFRIDVAHSLRKMGPKPTLIFHGDQDVIALPDQARRNIAACSGENEVVWFEGCGHSEGRWIRPVIYETVLLSFLERNGFIQKSDSLV